MRRNIVKITENIKDIMAFAKCSVDRAKKIEYQMDCNGIDYSECTTRKFHNAIRDAIVDIDYSIEDLDRILKALDTKKVQKARRQAVVNSATASIADKLAQMRANGVFK